MAKRDHKFDCGDEVYLISDQEQIKRQVVCVVKTPLGYMYAIRMDGVLVEVYEFELTADRGVI